MKFKFIGNAAGIFTGKSGTQILCDPWIVDGVFEGSWFHYPPLKTKMKDLYNVDGIYISHVHPDHYDERHFNFPKDIPIIILDQEPNFLKKNLIKKGYENLVLIKHGESKKFKEFKLTAYKPFTKHIFEESLLGNLIDSALVLTDGDITAINFNDNTPDEKACIDLKNKFKKIDFAMLNYNSAGPYPSCFDNLKIKDKKKEHNRILKRNFTHLCKIIPLLDPKTVIPFAGSYILGGKNSFKNEYLGTTTWDECSDFLKKNLNSKTKIICLRENQTYDILNQRSLDVYKKINIEEMSNYIQNIKNKKYDYEINKMPNVAKLKLDIDIAKKKLLESSKKFNVDIKSNVYINLDGKIIKILKGKDKNRKLICSLDNRLLRRILDRKSHWNNAEIGTHISFKRYPNKMDPDVHTIMSFFHL